jgi:hypothetical protein
VFTASHHEEHDLYFRCLYVNLIPFRYEHLSLTKFGYSFCQYLQCRHGHHDRRRCPGQWSLKNQGYYRY